MTTASSKTARSYMRFIPSEEVGKVSQWNFGAVDEAERIAAALAASKDDGSLQLKYDQGFQEGYTEGHAQGRLEAETRDVGPPSGSEHHAIDHKRCAVGQLDAVAVLDLLDRNDGLLSYDPDAAPLHLGTQVLPEVVIESPQDVVAAVDQRHL